MDRRSLRIGIDFKGEGTSSDMDAAALMQCARLAEELGFDSVWTNEDVGRDAIAILTAMAAVTRTIGVGSAIINVYTRSALQLAMGAATLDDVSRGRAVLGLSVGRYPWSVPGHGIPLEVPIARVREYVQFLRKAFTGQQFTHEGRFFKGIDTRLHFVPPRANLPIYIGGERPQIVALAGEVADGLIVNVVSPHYIKHEAGPRFHEAARKAGRDPATLELMALVTCCLSDDAEEAMDEARAMLVNRFRGSLEKRLATLDPQFRDEVRELGALVNAGEEDRAARQASEALVRSFVVAGNADDIWRGIERYFEAGCTRIALVSWPREQPYVERLLRAVAAGRAGTPAGVS